MARWRLTEDHYLNIEHIDGEPVVWDQAEIAMDTGRRKTRRFPVPMHLAIEDGTVQTPRNSGAVIVSNGKNANPGDHVFLGDPTPGMEPLDDEAREITERCSKNWAHPIESLSGNGQGLIQMFEKQMAELMANAAAQPRPVAAPAAGIDPAEFEKLKADIAELMKQNAQLQAQTERRV